MLLQEVENDDSQNIKGEKTLKTKGKNTTIERNTSSGSSLGVFRSQCLVEKTSPITRQTYQARLRDKTQQNKCSQTVLSFPCPMGNTMMRKTISQAGVSFALFWKAFH
jgi:hypothetical protein